jgi:hypothetical protein
MLINDPVTSNRNPGMPLIKLFLAGNASGMSGFLESSALYPENPSLVSVPGREEFNQ